VSKNKKYFEHIQKLLRDKDIPELDDELSQDLLFVQIHDELKYIREIIFDFSKGDLSASISEKGFIPGCLKNLQNNLRHLIGQIHKLELGDFSQEAHFIDEFSSAFNAMINKFHWNIVELQEKEKKLMESEAHLKVLATHDSLTGIYNRRTFIELMESSLTKAAESFIPCCLSMMDIDNFKIFNDTYGHLMGDEALRHVVKTVGDGLRENDLIGRYGGEEFLLFFFNTNEKKGFNIVERLRKKLSETPVLLDKNPVPIFASFGVVETSMEDPKKKNYIQKLINDADTALYAAKRAGRNRVVLYKPEIKEK
jgi:diguanylate cyclase (GGDEF)-like protein